MLLSTGFVVSVVHSQVPEETVPAADAVVRAEVPLDGEVVSLGLVPFRHQEHVLAVLTGEPGHGRSLWVVVISPV